MDTSTMGWENSEVTVRCRHGETVRDLGDEEGIEAREMLGHRAVEAHARRFACSCRPPGAPEDAPPELTFGELDRFMAAIAELDALAAANAQRPPPGSRPRLLPDHPPDFMRDRLN